MSDRTPEQEARRALTSKLAELVLEALQRGGFEVLKSADLARADAQMCRLEDENAILRAEVQRLHERLAEGDRRR